MRPSRDHTGVARYHSKPSCTCPTNEYLGYAEMLGSVGASKAGHSCREPRSGSASMLPAGTGPQISPARSVAPGVAVVKPFDVQLRLWIWP